MSVIVTALLASIPSPSSGRVGIGPLALNAYGLCIAIGAAAAVWLASKRWVALGGSSEDVPRIAYAAVPAGVVGARIYHVITDWTSFRGRWFDVVKIWEGGLGIWGGVALGVAVGLWKTRRFGLPLPVMLDVAAPAIPLAQAIGRWGNWFNVELFGRPSSLPWALEVPVDKRPSSFAAIETFHPTFLYESLWNLAICVTVIVAGRAITRRFRSGAAFAVYVAMYTFGRFFIERLRIDQATRVGPFRVNELVALALLAAALLALVVLRRRSGPVAATSGGPEAVPVAGPAALTDSD